MSKIRPKFVGEITLEGRIKLEPPIKEKLDLWLGSLAGQKVEIVIGKPENSRTNAENRYYWGVVVKLLADELGYSSEDMHELLKMQFNSKVLDVYAKADKLTPRKCRIGKSTASLKVEEFENYLESIRVWAATFLKVVIPLPNEVDLENISL